jgi:hypothetical protein
MLAQHMGVDPQRHRGIGVAEAGGNDVDRHACEQQSGGMQMAKIMKARVREPLNGLGDHLVVTVDHLRHEAWSQTLDARRAPATTDRPPGGPVPDQLGGCRELAGTVELDTRASLSG